MLNRTHPLLLTAALLALLCAAAAAQAQDEKVQAPWAALLGLHAGPCLGSGLPEEQRREFLKLMQEHQNLRRELGRVLYIRQLEYDVFAQTKGQQANLDELADEMRLLRRRMVEEDNRFCHTVKQRFGLDVSDSLHCAPSETISAEK